MLSLTMLLLALDFKPISIRSVIASTILNSSVTFVQSAVGRGGLYPLQITVAFLRTKKKASQLIDNKPLLLMDGQQLLHQNMRKAKITETDI